MTRYSTELKIEVVSKYLNHVNSLLGLEKEYDIPNYQIFRWVKFAQKQRLEALRVKHTKKEYSFEFKLDVVRYYLTNNQERTEAAARFNINPSQVYSWIHKFNEEGIAGLKPNQKGCPRKIPKKTKYIKKELRKLSLARRKSTKRKSYNKKLN
uniref:transposase n=1 Tax=Lactobacillus taiwanensis TaxID=508451 RepID=UPI00255836C4|nr:transposase [Lactobacillus taiwanensis]